MSLFFSRRKMSFTDAVASRFAFWIINDKEPPDASGVKDLEQERKRHLVKLILQVGIYVSLGLATLPMLPEWALVIVAIVLLLAVPKLWLFARDSIATRVLFQPASAVPGLVAEVEQACERSPAVQRYYRRVQRLGRPVLRIEAVALATVPGLDEGQWRE